jgi:modulator of FtsH protease HflC
VTDRSKLFLAVSTALVLFLLLTSIFVVNETQQVMVIRFGNPVAQIREPGLHFKLPVIDNARVFEKRILNVDPPAEEVLLTDQKRLVVDTFARYRIRDMLMFFQTLNSETAGEARLNTIINAAVRSNLGRVPLRDVLSAKRNLLMSNILRDVNATTKRFGVEVVDVRIVRADLPPQVTQSTFDRMQSEREREAKEARAEGEQIGLEIRSQSDKQRTILLSEAQRDAQILRGEGDREAITVYARAFSRDPQFYKFYRSLEAYRKSLAQPDTTLLLSPDNNFFDVFQKSAPAAP